MQHTEKDIKSNLALYFNSRALSLQLYRTRMSVTGFFSHLKVARRKQTVKTMHIGGLIKIK